MQIVLFVFLKHLTEVICFVWRVVEFLKEFRISFMHVGNHY